MTSFAPSLIVKVFQVKVDQWCIIRKSSRERPPEVVTTEGEGTLMRSQDTEISFGFP
jgi:hypothetical protein